MTEQTTPESVKALADGLTEGERERLLFGRLDWRENRWQDHCGDLECPHCTGLIPDPEPRRLSPFDAALRAHIGASHD